MRRFAAAVLVLVLGAGLTGCRSQEQKYCDTLKADRVQLDDMLNSHSNDAIFRTLPVLQELEGAAPDDLTDEWQTYVNAVLGLRDALKAANVAPSDFVHGEVPASVTGQKRQDIVAAADALSSEDLVSAVTGIETQARDVCKINLGF